MPQDTIAEIIVLLVQVGSRRCALPIADVRENMRPLHTDPVPGMPPFLLGIAIIRGSPVPVVDLGVLLGLKDEVPIERFVLLASGERKIVLAVESVLGIRQLESADLKELPPLLKDHEQEMIAAIAVKDEQLLVVLRSARMIPDEVWQTLEAHGRGEL
jgi:purine-binding chemotaxis protein CheW